MATPKHAAFLDLEETLAHRFRNAWSRYWTPLSEEMVQLAARSEFDAAHRLAESIDLAPLFDRQRTFARTVGMAALLLGASRVSNVRHSHVAKSPPKKELYGLIDQMGLMLSRNATQKLREQAHAWVHEEESKLLKFDPSQPRDERGRWTDVTGTPEFKAWFGESKVVDAEGNPLRVYHGTTADIDEFKLGNSSNADMDTGVGFFFAGSASEAGFFTQEPTDLMGSRSDQYSRNAAILPVYLRIKNPKVYETQAEYRADFDEAPYNREGRGEAMFQHLSAQGYDGVIVRDSMLDGEGSGAWYVAFYAEQVKSAFNSRPSNDPHLMKGEVVNQEEHALTKADWNEEEHPRGKTTPDSTPGSFTSVTGTPAFKAWFGGSKVVDAEGNPLRVYHGTTAEFSVFDSSLAGYGTDSNRDGAYWFSDSPEVAGVFAGSTAGGSYTTVGGEKVEWGRSQILPVFLSMKNPYIDEKGKYAKQGGLTRALIRELENDGYDGVIWPESSYDLPDTTDQGPVKGYRRDRFGRVFGNEVPYPTQYAVFHSNQIKSVFNAHPTKHPDLTKAEKADPNRNQVKINVAGKNYFGLAASIQVSRLSAFGFLAEAADAGILNYRIDAVLDERTCEVCRQMDGWVFPVEAGMALAQQIMDTDDPDTLKSIAPFYAQNKASLAALKGYATEDFINEGMSLPPFHPLCRCILTPTDEPADIHPTQLSDRVALASQTLYGEGDGTRLTQDLFGLERAPDDAVAPPTPEESTALQRLLDLLANPPDVFAPFQARTPTEAAWIKDVVSGWLEPTDVPPAALITPQPFEGTTIPQDYVKPFDPAKLRQLAASRWPWLAGLLGWLALRDREPEPALVPDDEEYDDEELP